MVWGCMSWSGVGNMEFIDGIMTKTVYLDILRRNLQESVRKLELGRRFVFQEDNDPKHTALVIKDFIKENKIKRLDWPSQSPDMNPIEHLWDSIGREIKKNPPKNKNDPKKGFLEAWQNIRPEIT